MPYYYTGIFGASLPPFSCRHHMALHIERVPLTSERKATKVLHLCQQFQMREQGGCHTPLLTALRLNLSFSLSLSAQSVCRVLAMREFRSGRLGVALSWCLRARDSIFAAFLAEKYVKNCPSDSPVFHYTLCHGCLPSGTLTATRHWGSSWTLTSWTILGQPCCSARSSLSLVTEQGSGVEERGGGEGGSGEGRS